MRGLKVRMLGIILAVILAFGQMPAMVYADETEPAAAVETAVDENAETVSEDEEPAAETPETEEAVFEEPAAEEEEAAAPDEETEDPASEDEEMTDIPETTEEAEEETPASEDEPEAVIEDEPEVNPAEEPGAETEDGLLPSDEQEDEKDIEAAEDEKEDSEKEDSEKEENKEDEQVELLEYDDGSVLIRAAEAYTGNDTAVTITENGTYYLDEGLKVAITVAAGVTELTIIGCGVEYNPDWTSADFGTISSVANAVTIDAKAAPGIHITLQDLFNSVKENKVNVINFAGTGNRLTIEGTVVMDYDWGYTSSNDALLHVGPDASLTIDGSGWYYQYNCTQGAGIGGTTGEMNGDITFAMTGYGFFKGTRQGAVIGAGARANGSGVPGSIRFTSGTYNVITNSRGAAIGGSAGSGGASSGTEVTISGNATLSVNTDFSGAAVGGGGYAEGNDSSGGTLYVDGGSFRPYVDKNAASNVATGWNGKTLTEGVNDAVVTAYRTNGQTDEEGALVPVYLCAVNLDYIDPDASGKYTVSEGENNVLYSGFGHSYVYAFDGIDRSTSSANVYPNSTIGNWIPNQDNCLYLWVTGNDHTFTINGATREYLFDAETETFTEKPSGTPVVIHASVTGATTIEDAQVILSKGTGYTYLEDTIDEYKREVGEEKKDITVTFYVPKDGQYTVTIVADGYYASEYSIKVTGTTVTGISTNVNSFLINGIFEIPLTEFVPSGNPGAWDGKTLDVTWYSEDAAEMYISTPAQLMGMAAIDNGIYNAEITAIIDNIEGETKSYTPREYAALANRKIHAMSSDGSTGGPNGGNLQTTGTYWYGVMSDGVTPSDFHGQTVYITADLDMGGYIKDANASNYLLKWSGARYMSIGGQSLMHYIDFGAPMGSYYIMSDGYSVLGSSFNGTLDGQGHLIKNIYGERTGQGSNFGDSQSFGIVGRLGNHDGDPASLAVKNPTVRNIAAHGYIASRRSVGAIVGKTGQSLGTKGGTRYDDGPVIENCVNFCEVYNTDAKGGAGIVGAGWNGAQINNCINYGTVYAGRQNAGGISGSDESRMINCLNVGYVDAITYNQAQAIGTNNGVSSMINTYWLRGSSFGAMTGVPKADRPSWVPANVPEYLDETSANYIKFSAYFNYSASRDDLTEVTSFEELTSSEFLAKLNGTSRAFTKASQSDPIYALLAATTFENCRLDTTGITAVNMPVPRVFVSGEATVTNIEKTADPTVTEYVAGQTFSDAGLEIWATWSDGTREKVTDYTTTVGSPLTAEDTQVVFSGSKGGMEYSYTVALTISDRTVDHIQVVSQPTNKVYAMDEEFDPAGMVVRAYYTDAPSTYVALSPLSDEVTDGYTYELDGSVVTVSYTYMGKTVTDSFEITKLNIPTPVPGPDGYYSIGSQDELVWFTNQVTNLKKTTLNARVTADFSADNTFNGMSSGSANAFKGTFDGAGHTITVDLVYSNSYCGFFRVAGDGAVIKDLTVAGTVNGGTGTYAAAGIVANVLGGKVVIENCVNKAEITSKGVVGGIAGRVYQGTVEIRNCVNEGSISTTNNYLGGIAGYIYLSTTSGPAVVEGCVNKGAITSTTANVGGVAGYIASNNAANCVTIRNCGNDEAVQGTQHVGGVVGYSNNINDRIDGCYNHGAVTGTAVASNGALGGAAGYFRGQILNSYNTGAVIGTATNANAGIGGLIGLAYPNSNTTVVAVNCYNAVDAVNNSTTITASPGALIGRLNNYNSTLNNTYYLTTELPVFGSASKTTLTVNGAASKTPEELRGLAETLGEAFDETCGRGVMYPTLIWEEHSEHDWADPAWTWTEKDGSYTASAAFACQDCDFEKTVDAVVSAVSTAACGAAGQTTYTAKVSLNGETYIDTKVVEAAALEHSWSAPEWNWTGNDADGYTAAQAVFTCTNCGEKQTVDAEVTPAVTEAGCETDGKTVYTASAEFGGETISTTMEVVIPATGHAWNEPQWSWAEDYSTASLVFTCKNDPEHTMTLTGIISTEITLAPTYTTAGTAVHTAEAAFDGVTYTDTQEQALPAIGYSWANPVWTWGPDNAWVLAKFQNTVNPALYKVVEGTIAAETTPVTCEEDGIRTSTATVIMEEQTFTDVKEEVIAEATGHKPVKTEAVDASCEEDGNTEYYTCSVCGKFFSDEACTKEVEEDSWMIPATGHDWYVLSYQWADDNSSVTGTLACRNDETHFLTETVETEAEVVSEADCTHDGATRYVAAFENKLFAILDKTVYDVPAPGHQMVKTEATATSCGEAGSMEYYTCTVCGKYFSDEQGKTEIEEGSWIVDRLPHTFEENGFCAVCGTYNPDDEDGVYVVTTAAHLAEIARAVNACDALTGKTVQIGADIDLADYSNWIAIGSSTLTPFEGTFDGKNYAITNLSITTGAAGYKGLFGYSKGTVKDFSISGSIGSADVYITSGADNIGGAVGWNDGTVSGVKGNVAIFVRAGIYAVGGIVGQNGDDGIISSCLNSADLNVSKASGGIVGRNWGVVTLCKNTGNITGNQGGKDGIGGIVGFAGNKDAGGKDNSITYCYNTGTITNNGGRWHGGIAGFAEKAATVTNCYDIGAITPGYSWNWNAVIGHVDSAYSTVHDNYSLDTLTNGDSSASTKPLTVGTQKTEEELKASDFIALINGTGSGFQANCGGYPVLSWEEAKAHVWEEKVTESTYTKEDGVIPGNVTYTCSECGETRVEPFSNQVTNLDDINVYVTGKDGEKKLIATWQYVEPLGDARGTFYDTETGEELSIVKDFTKAENQTGTVNGMKYDITAYGAMPYVGFQRWQPAFRARVPGVVLKGILIEDLLDYCEEKAGISLRGDTGMSLSEMTDSTQWVGNYFTYNDWYGVTRYYYPHFYDTVVNANEATAKEAIDWSDGIYVPSALSIVAYSDQYNNDLDYLKGAADSRMAMRNWVGLADGPTYGVSFSDVSNPNCSTMGGGHFVQRGNVIDFAPLYNAIVITDGTESGTAGTDLTYTVEGVAVTSADHYFTANEGETVTLTLDGSAVTLPVTGAVVTDADGEEVETSFQDGVLTFEMPATAVAVKVTIHEHTPAEAVKENVIPATCTEAGSHEEVVYCSECGEELSRESAADEALGHDWDEGVITKQPTKTEDGIMTYTCKNDSTHVRTESVPYVAATKLTLNPTKAEVATLATLQLKATIKPENASSQTLTWTSSDTSVATVDKNGLVKAKTYGTVTITAKTADGQSASCKIQTRFNDVTNSGKAYYTPVYWAVDNGITKCTVTFKPDDNVTRGEFVAFIWRLAGQPKSTAKVSLTDVNSGTKFYSAIRWAVGEGIIKGYSDKTFRADNTVTRGEAATMLWRFAGKPQPKTAKSPFSDIQASTADSYKAILWGNENGIIKGSGGKFLKNDGCTRGNIVTFLYRYNTNILKK